MTLRRRDVLGMLAAGACAVVGPVAAAMPEYDVRAFGAVGDGRDIDSPAINRTIAAAAAGGGGTVRVPAGTYLCFSIRLRSLVTLHLEAGATIMAAEPGLSAATPSGYDPADPFAPWDAYQDFGHSHWQNSLIWGEGIHDVAITGPGRIWGRGLVRELDEVGRLLAAFPGVGDKAIALRHCRNVVMRDFSILAGGHFGILATGVDSCVIDNLSIDTNRDGIDVDCCRDVRISNCRVNSPYDDAICLKSSLALGAPRITENVVIANCFVSGDYRVGTLLDRTRQSIGHEAVADPGQRTGRIKLGTESNGGFRNISILNCVFQSCRGLALETVDGGVLEDVTVTGLVMRDLRSAPLFLRLGARLRGPAGLTPGILRRVRISDVVCEAPLSIMPSIISGVPGHPIEDVEISDMRVMLKGGGTAAMCALLPPEQVAAYPDPNRFGMLPAQGFFIRHARGLRLRNVEIDCATTDARPAFWLRDVADIDIDRLRVAPPPPVATLALRDVTGLRISNSPNVSADHGGGAAVAANHSRIQKAAAPPSATDRAMHG